MVKTEKGHGNVVYELLLGEGGCPLRIPYALDLVLREREREREKAERAKGLL